jgi:hypothetical protein
MRYSLTQPNSTHIRRFPNEQCQSEKRPNIIKISNGENINFLSRKALDSILIDFISLLLDFD